MENQRPDQVNVYVTRGYFHNFSRKNISIFYICKLDFFKRKKIRVYVTFIYLYTWRRLVMAGRNIVIIQSYYVVLVLCIIYCNKLTHLNFLKKSFSNSNHRQPKLSISSSIESPLQWFVWSLFYSSAFPGLICLSPISLAFSACD